MKKKIVFLTEDSFWDTDISVFPHLVHDFDIQAIVIDTPSDNKYPQKHPIPGLTIEVFKRQKRMRNLVNFFFALKIFKKVYTLSKTHTVLYAFNIDPYLNFLFLLFIKPQNAIVSFHNFESHSDAQNFEKWGKKVILKKYHYFHFHSELQYKLFNKRFPDKEAFYTTMPLKDFGSLPEGMGLPSDRRVFLFFGFIRKYKKLELLLNAFNQVAQPNAVLCIAGNCKEWEYYEPLVKDKNRYELQIRFIDNAEIPQFFVGTHFLVLPYSDATQSGPLLTAVHYNTPIIASDIEAFRSVISDNEDGFLFEADNQGSLQRVLKKAIDMSEEEYYKMKARQLAVKMRIDSEAASSGKKFSDFIDNMKTLATIE